MRHLAQNLLFAALLMATSGVMMGCQKKCQKPAVQAFESLTSTPWRLVETTDPDTAFRALNKVNFVVYSFGQDFNGDVKKVENNTQFDAPIITFKYNPDVEAGVIRIESTITASGGTATGGTQASGTTETTDYLYELGRELLLTDSARGYSYRFVDFRGIVNPDSTCTF